MVDLNDGAGGYHFTTNAIDHLAIVAGAEDDVVIVGSATQSVTGGSNHLRVMETATNASPVVVGDIGGATLELTTGGTIVLNRADINLTVVLHAPFHLTLPTM